jgi:A/G-specific adenine glycosylase
MELGATVCLPNGAPYCAECPLAELCRSKDTELWRKIPVKEQKKARRQEEKTVFLLRCDGRLAVRKRPPQGLLAGRWEFPNVEGILEARAALAQASAWGCHPRNLVKALKKQHIFTHITWEMTAYVIECSEPSADFLWADERELDEIYSLPTAFRQFRE